MSVVKKILLAMLAVAVVIGGLIPAYAAAVDPAKTLKVLGRELHTPMGIAADRNGKIYVSAYGDSQIGRLKEKRAEVFAGMKFPRDMYNQAQGGYLDEAIQKAAFSKPSALISYSNGLLVADSGNNVIRLIKNANVYTYSGMKAGGYLDGVREGAEFSSPSGLAADTKGNVYVADTGNQVIRMISKEGKVTTVAGVPHKAGFADGKADTALFNDPMGLLWHKGSLYIADSGNQRIRMLKEGKVTTVAGGGDEKYPDTDYYMGDYVEGNALKARFNNPQNLAADLNGNIYIADVDNSAVRVLSGGKVSTFLDGSRSKLSRYLVEPYGLMAKNGKLYVSDKFTDYVISVDLPK